MSSLVCQKVTTKGLLGSNSLSSAKISTYPTCFFSSGMISSLTLTLRRSSGFLPILIYNSIKPTYLHLEMGKNRLVWFKSEEERALIAGIFGENASLISCALWATKMFDHRGNLVPAIQCSPT